MLTSSRPTLADLWDIPLHMFLHTAAKGPSIAIHHPESVLDGMNDWCKEHHVKSGLVDRVRASQVTLEQAEQQVLQFVAAHTEPGAAQLAGNSVHVDRIFLQRYMPELLGHLHYRIVDVSTIKECARCAATVAQCIGVLCSWMDVRACVFSAHSKRTRYWELFL